MRLNRRIGALGIAALLALFWALVQFENRLVAEPLAPAAPAVAAKKIEVPRFSDPPSNRSRIGLR